MAVADSSRPAATGPKPAEPVGSRRKTARWPLISGHVLEGEHSRIIAAIHDMSSTCWNLAAKVKRKLERYNQHVARQRLADFLNRSGER
jgi:hypothetical protein